MAEEVLGSGISKGVTDQLLLRESLIGERNKSKDHLLFFNSNGAWVRLVSSVNTLTEKESKEFSDNPLILQEREEQDKKFGSNLLAANNILFGGMYPQNQTPDGGILSEKWHKPQRIDDNGFYNVGNVKTAYYHNYESTGHRPVPGITSVKIQSKNTYGTLREAEVSITVWTLEDLELMQTLYLRPGYSMLLEWGHSLKLENNNTSEISISSEIKTYLDFVKEGQKQADIETFLLDNAKNNSYNYDAMYGYVNNFSWTFRPDGGYDCSVKIISKGAILESLALTFDTTNVYPPNLITTGNEETSKEERDSIFHKFRSELRKAEPTVQNLSGYTFPNKPKSEQDPLAENTLGMFATSRILKKELNLPTAEPFKKLLHDDILAFAIPYSAEIQKEERTHTISGKKFYIRLGTMLDIYNTFLPTIDPTQDAKKGTKSEGYKYVEFYTGWQDENTDAATDYEKESKFITTKYHFSINPLICIIPGQLDDRGLEFKDPRNNCRDAVEAIRERTKDDLATTSNMGTIQIGNLDLAVNVAFSKYESQKIRGQKDDILNILISLDHIIDIKNQLIKEDQDSDQNTSNNMTVFMQRLLKDINKSLGGVNDLDVTYDEFENLFFVVDRRLTPNNTALPKLSLAGINTTLSNLNISSKISSNISSQISIAAQAGNQGSKDNIGPLLQWNKGLIDRHLKVKSPKTPSTSAAEGKAVETDRLIKFLEDYMEVWRPFKVESRQGDRQYIVPVPAIAGIGGFLLTNISLYLSGAEIYETKLLDETQIENLGSLESYHRTYCQKYVTDYYFKYKDNVKPPPGVIPVELSFTTIGIAGLKIGQAFRLERGVLPQVYSDDFGFIITGLSHDITNNKWTTEVKTQFFCLKPPPEEVQTAYMSEFTCAPVAPKDQTNETACTTAYPELRIIEVNTTAATPILLRDTDVVKYLRLKYQPKIARAVFALMLAEARYTVNSGNFASPGGNNFGGFQTDNARWGGGVEQYFNGQFCRRDSGGVNRMFASFATYQDFLDATANRVASKGFDGENAVSWTNTYIQKWWSPAGKANYTEGTQVFREKQRIYERAMRIYEARSNTV